LHSIKTLIRIFSVTGIISIIFISSACSQLKQNNITARNTVYADFASKGAYYSINYDRVFSQGKKFTKSYRAGFSIFNNVIAFPLGINFFNHPGKNNHVEFGLTAVTYIEAYNSFLASNDLSDKKMYIIPGAGYRYQKPAGGFFFKAIAAPLIYLDPPSDHFWKMDVKVYPALTIGAGYSF
jgi:hypothetical protein